MAGAWGGGGRGTVAVCDADEDTLTLAWRAAVDALEAAGVDRRRGLRSLVGHRPTPLRRRPQPRLSVHRPRSRSKRHRPALLGLAPCRRWRRSVAAWDALAAGHARLALVVASDALLPGIGTAGEFSTGAGAAAFVLGAIDAATGGNGSGPPARLLRRTSSVLAVVDRYRGDAEKATGDVYDPRLFREEVFLPLLTAVGQELVATADSAGSGAATSAPAGWAIADPDGQPGPGRGQTTGRARCSRLPSRPRWATPAPPPPCSGPSTAAPRSLSPAVIGTIAYGGGRATARDRRGGPARPRGGRRRRRPGGRSSPSPTSGPCGPGASSSP